MCGGLCLLLGTTSVSTVFSLRSRCTGRMKGKEGAPKNPRAVAEAIVAAVPENDIIEKDGLR